MTQRLRLWSGLVLFAYVAGHLLNHTFGLASVEAMEAGRRVFAADWRSPPGMALLGAGFAVHGTLSIARLFRGRSFRMPAWEAAQQLLGLAIRRAWPRVRIVLRGDSAFCRHRMLDWCDRHGVGYIVGLARNAVLEHRVQPSSAAAEYGFRATRHKVRLFTEFAYAARTWRRTRRVIARIEHGPKGRNPRFIVTNLPGPANELYERVYCQRGEMEKPWTYCPPSYGLPTVCRFRKSGMR